MSRSVRISLLAGGLVAIAAFLLVDHGGHLGTQLLQTAVLGVALGAAVALVPDGSLAWRAGAFGWGMVLAWGGYAIRAGFLPDIPIGRAIAAAIVVVLVTGATVLSMGRMPLWAGLAGVAAMVGAYEVTFSADPTAFKSEGFTALTSIGLTAAIGLFIGCAGFIPLPGRKARVAVQPVAPALPTGNGHKPPERIVIPPPRQATPSGTGIGIAPRKEGTS
jgi:hypothetical protein